MENRLYKFVVLFTCALLGCKNETTELFHDTYSYMWNGTPVTLKTGYFNRDNLPDIVISTTGRESTIFTLLSNGDSTFSLGDSFLSNFSYDTEGYHSPFTTHELNLDGIDDIICADTDIIEITLVNETGRFIKKNIINHQELFVPESIVVGLFNSDNIPDVVTGDFFGQLMVLIGIGDGGFDRVVYKPDYISGILGSADFNNDGVHELVVALRDGNGRGGIGIISGVGAGGFDDAYSFYAVKDYLPSRILVNDFNNDGIKDILATGSLSLGFVPVIWLSYPLNRNGLILPANDTEIYYFSVLIGRGDGSFNTPLNYPVGESPTERILIDDFNLDGFNDIAVLSALPANLTLWLGNGEGIFEEFVNYDVGEVLANFVKGEFNGDGIPDIAVINYRSKDVIILLGKGDGTFDKQFGYGLEFEPFRIVAEDFNTDGLSDLVAGGSDPDGRGIVSLLIANGD